MNDTPEAVLIPQFNPRMRNIPTPPRIFTNAGAAAVEIYNELTEPRCKKIYLQNRSTSTVEVSWNTIAATGNSHAILCGGTANNDGLGAVMELDCLERGIKSLSVISAATLNLSVEKFQFAQNENFIN